MTTGKFVALPVRFGDCFFYKWDDYTAIIDGGIGRPSLPSLLKDYLPGQRELRVVLCTHSDTDHSAGLIQLLTHWNGTIREVWLPGQWYQRLEDLLQSPYEFAEELADDVASLDLSDDPGFPIKLENLLDLDEFERFKVDRLREQRLQRENGGETGEKPDSASTSEDMDLGEDVAITSSGWLIHMKLRSYPDSYRKARLFVEALEVADIIREIARAAYVRGAKVRWFDYDKFYEVGESFGGDPGLLVPLNSCEVKPRRVKVGALFYLAMSHTNRRSLAFLSPENLTLRKPGVLFSAESDFNFVFTEPMPSGGMIATVPHHGSESHTHAYKLIEDWHRKPHKIIWVRSNGQPKCRPGSTFLSRKPKMRLCTQCRPEILPYQAVVLHTTKAGRGWSIPANLRSCSCST